MKRLSGLALATLLMTAAPLVAPITAHAQDAAALCKILASPPKGTVIHIPLDGDIAHQIQGLPANSGPGTLVDVHGDGKVTVAGQDITQQATTACANPKTITQDQQAQDQSKASDNTSSTPVTHHHSHVHSHPMIPADTSTDSGDHYTPSTAGTGPATGTGSSGTAAGASTNGSGASSQSLGTISNSGSANGAPLTSPLSSGAGTASPENSPMGAPASSSSSAQGTMGSTGGAVYTPPPSSSATMPPANALSGPMPTNGSPNSPTISGNLNQAPPPGVMAPNSEPASSTSLGGSSMGSGGSMSGGSTGGSGSSSSSSGH